MSPIGLLIYLTVVVWAMIKSNKRWMTLLWIVVGLAVTIGAFAGASAIWPDLAGVLGHTVLIPSFLVSAVLGLHHMRSHRRSSTPKTATP